MTEIKKYHKFITHNFGDRHRFGITFEMCETREGYIGRYLRGSICYWFFGSQIGDMAYGVSLACEGLGEIENVLKKSAHRCVACPRIFDTDGRLIIDVMNEDMEVDEEDREENPLGFISTFDFWFNDHNITLNLDVMEDHLLLFFENETQSRIIWVLLSEDKEKYVYHKEFFLEKGEFDNVLEEARKWLRMEFEKELALDSPDDWWNQSQWHTPERQ